jgi:hypothetical protein
MVLDEHDARFASDDERSRVLLVVRAKPVASVISIRVGVADALPV